MTETDSKDRVADPERLSALRRSGLLRRDASAHLDRLTTLASELIQAPVALISMVDDRRQFFSSHWGLSEPWASLGETPLSHSVCRDVVASEAPVVLAHLGGRDDYVDHPARHELDVEAYCGVPIYDPDGHILGSFCVIDSRNRSWGPDVVTTLMRLADLVTDSVATTQDFAALTDDLQARLLPERLPVLQTGELLASYRPVPDTDEIGGDFYDALLRPDGGFDLVVGDVIGHGVRSTQAASQLRAATRAVLAAPAATPADVLNRVAAACVDLPGCESAALLVARFSPDGREVTWARSGAMPPLLIRAEPTILHEGAWPPLGVADCGTSQTQQLASADEQLLFFTDGLVERRGELIDDGLRRLMDAAAVIDDLEYLVDAVCPPERQADDVSVVRWSPAPLQ